LHNTIAQHLYGWARDSTATEQLAEGEECKRKNKLEIQDLKKTKFIKRKVKPTTTEKNEIWKFFSE